MSQHPKLSQKKLRRLFTCYGHFYTLKIDDNKNEECRSVLEIVLAGSEIDDISTISAHTPDAIAVMMNPGGAKPDIPQGVIFQKEVIDIRDFHIDFINKPLVKAIPDETQDRIMNVMNVVGWTHVRIVNLSDVCEKDSDSLDNHLANFEDSAYASRHSIFSSNRSTEREKAFCVPEPPLLLLGWGTLDILGELSEIAINYFESISAKYIGIKPVGVFFYHPKRHKDWHDKIINQILEL